MKKHKEQTLLSEFITVTANTTFKWVSDSTYRYVKGQEYTVSASTYTQLKQYFDVTDTQPEPIITANTEILEDKEVINNE